MLRNLARTSQRTAANRLVPAIAMTGRRQYATPDESKADRVKNITVFGAGLMGSGIVQVAAQSGYKVVMTDVTDKALENGMNIINKSLARVAKKAAPKAEKSEEEWTKQVLSRISTAKDPAEAVQKADLVIEAIIENLKIKQDLFAFLDTRASKECIFASNTSALSVAEISSKCSEERRTRFAGVHFMQPVPAMRLVEIIKAPKTEPEIIETLLAIMARMGKTPVNCLDTPGFIVNRLLIPYLMESVRMAERGEATPEDIDTAMELGTGHPMGPFKLLDFIGLDTASHIVSGWEDKAEKGLIEKSAVQPVGLLQKMISEGRLGRKSGRGFYDYSSKL